MIKRKRVFCIIIVMAALGIIANQGQTQGPKTMDINDKSVRFSLGFFNEIINEEGEQNIFVSPLSARMAMAMALNGTGGMTKEEMRAALGFGNLSNHDINGQMQQITKSLEAADPKVVLNIANSLWLLANMNFKKSYFDTVTAYYDAEVAKTQDVGVINNWVSKNTNQKIKNIIDRIGPNDILLLINAIYFKGEWKYKFDEKLTHDGNFHLLNSDIKKVPLMSQSGKFRYFENDDFQSIVLPYGNERLSMHIFLPAQNGPDYKKFLAGFNAENWSKWNDSYTMTDGDILLPKFKLEYEKVLNIVLKNLGIQQAFNPELADFSGLLENFRPGLAWISYVKQKAFIEVNEEGTEAAAATAVMLMTKSMSPEPKRFRMVVDHPFVCAIVDDQTGEILFIGSIVDPGL
ncbi:MAG: serpin family protein [Candidatus Zixiibacteriota bacterium]